MVNHKKTIKKLRNKSQVDYKDVESLLVWLGYKIDNKGKTSGSRVVFVKDDSIIQLHKPHPRKELLPYQVRDILKVVKGL
ncbi:type II toxin-antitoxin system HicA family toxin [Ligilactobacillus equi]|nr:type II toxin-antitoxin system HicA family toxin [Ligilactobacillus equi]